MQIRIRNFDTVLMRLQMGEGRLKEDLQNKYKQAVEQTAGNVVRDAAAALNKPGWELSRAIRASRIKEYRNRRVIFQAVEPEGSKNPAPNTPGAYAWYHEHGYTVQASSVARPRSGRIIRKGTKRAAYRKQPPKWFFKQAAEANLPRLQAEINRINAETKLEL